VRTFLKEELERFLMAIDRALGRPVEVVVIGEPRVPFTTASPALPTTSIPGRRCKMTWPPPPKGPGSPRVSMSQ
jgi:hypothetical protein